MPTKTEKKALAKARQRSANSRTIRQERLVIQHATGAVVAALTDLSAPQVRRVLLAAAMEVGEIAMVKAAITNPNVLVSL